MLEIEIDRKQSFSNSLAGDLFVNGLYICRTLELAWWWNENDLSCVPPGNYSAFIRTDKKDGWRIQLSGVPGSRTGVQIHIGNYPKEIKGCVLVGEYCTPGMIWHSGKAYQKLEAACRPHDKTQIQVRFTGILMTPWGDYKSQRDQLLA
ncbi:MAG TPA: DUF5675 family protein [Terriglobales bacterium]|nr:DUF5675 family protein [Terriglobales bacterium]